jgi:hypothetical protein
MANKKSANRKLYSILGVLLLGMGLTILLAQIDIAASHLADRVRVSGSEAVGTVPAAIMTTLRAAQALAFDRANVLSAVREMLLSCWPVILVIVGAALLRNAFNGFARSHRNGAVSVQGEL